ncbi:GNAT family N-acetyltransferase [Pasteurellaceae bacterium Pebbles2]|nr:GNAT family N-acetyltransferase [Pasteurellaceae bacterium Pebbles2]
MKIRPANKHDFSAIIAIYNQAIPSRRITADLTPVTEQQRQAWFNTHLDNPTHPIWVLMEEENLSENAPHFTEEKAESAVKNEKVLGWCSFSPFYQRAAFNQTVEISLYLDQSAKGKGYGTKALQFMQSQMATCSINTLMAYVIEENHASRKLFEKQGFQQWARYPNIANMGDSLQTFLVYGFQQLG